LGRFAAVPAEEFSITSLVDGFRAHIADTVAGISRLKGAALERSLEVVFQPIVRLDTRVPHHFEMLARFEGDKSPFEMIRFAEGIGLIEEIDLRICQRALAVLETLNNPLIDIAVNVSGKSLASDIFVQSLLALLQPSGSLRERILFEITESTGIADLVRAERVLATLRRAGHHICLDDFGAGASCFPYLQALNVDFVKIDGAYIGRIGEAQRDRAIIKSMIGLCRELQIGTIAEKIERAEQVKELLGLGVDFGQGFHLGRPTPMPAMPSRITG
jgi:EAL domain-containing protein (putative c-di-GMP-specific phosphodiesterase class I)